MNNNHKLRMGWMAACVGLSIAVALAEDAPAPTADQPGSSSAAATASATNPSPAAPPRPSTSASATATGGTMDAVVVRDVPLEQDVMPTSRPFNSAYGMDLSIMDTPRNVTIISREQLDAIDIESVRDFTKLTSSSYSRSNFGAPTVPDIRGQSADMFVNGMRKGLTSNGNGLPIDFNSVESVNIVKGPASAIYGASQYVGGHVDIQTKQPYFDKFQGEASVTVGSYGRLEQTLDFGGPIIKDELAYRFSYSGNESGGYYENEDNKMQAGYLAVSWTPKNLNYTLDFNSEFATYDYTENWGYNRPTQNLISNGQYFSTLPTPAGANPNTAPLIPGGLVSIPQNARLHNPGDGSDGKSFDWQIIQTTQLADDVKLVNNSFYQYIDRKTLSSYYYDEVLKNNQSFENRTEIHWDFDNHVTDDKTVVDSKDPKAVAKVDPGLTFRNNVVTGLDVRYQYNDNYDNFGNEPANFWDLSQARSTVLYPQPLLFANNPGLANVPGLGSYYTFNAGNGDSAESDMVSVGPFWQHHIEFTPHWQLDYGMRIDEMHVEASDPPGSPEPILHGSTDEVLTNANVSPVYKPFEWMSTYFTYNYSQYTGGGNGGAFTPTMTPSDYHRDAELYEMGVKFDLLNHSLFANLATYIQDRVDNTQGGNPVQEHRRGVEAELNYQPNKNWFATASYAFTRARTDNPGFVAQLRPIDELPLAGGGVEDVNTGGLLSGSGRTPGVPDHVFNFLVQYQHDSGFGANIGMVVTSDYDLGYGSDFTIDADFGTAGLTGQASSVRIPWQYSIDAALFYKQPKWEAKLSFYNITDQRNFSPVNAIYGNSSVVRDEPFELAGTVKYKF